MKLFLIYLAMKPTYLAEPNQARRYMTMLCAESLSDAFAQGQSCINPNWDYRSISVGDAIEDMDGALWMVSGTEFVSIPQRHYVQSYIGPKGLRSVRTLMDSRGKHVHDLIKEYLSEHGLPIFNSKLDVLYDIAITEGSMSYYNHQLCKMINNPDMTASIRRMLKEKLQQI